MRTDRGIRINRCSNGFTVESWEEEGPNYDCSTTLFEIKDEEDGRREAVKGILSFLLNEFGEAGSRHDIARVSIVDLPGDKLDRTHVPFEKLDPKIQEIVTEYWEDGKEYAEKRW